MAKRSQKAFKRIDKDRYYTTDIKAMVPSFVQMIEGKTYYEPCVGKGDLIKLIGNHAKCVGSSDIEFENKQSALNIKGALALTKDDLNGADYIITNPPWDRKILHLMIRHFTSMTPTFLLFDADWMHTIQAIPYLQFCTHIISVGRMNWFPEEGKTCGKDNVAWYRFQKDIIEDYHPVFVPKFELLGRI